MLSNEQIILAGVLGVTSLVVFLFAILLSDRRRTRKRTSKGEQKLAESIMKKLDENIKELITPSKRTQLILLMISIFITIVTSIHALNEAWAWEVAKALITIDGLVLGFAILAATVLSSGRIVNAAHKAMINESVDEIMKSMQKESEVEFDKFVEEELMAVAVKPFFQLEIFGEIFRISVVFLLISIGFALCLFGVSDTRVRLVDFLFVFIFSQAVNFFVQGAYRLTNGIFVLLEKGGIPAKEHVMLLAKMLKEKRRDYEEQKAKRDSK